MAKVAFLGLGVMGFPMAGHLVKKGGHEVTVYNRTAAKAKEWADKFGGKTAATPKAAAEGQDFVMCCVGNDNDLRAVDARRRRRVCRHEERRGLRRSHHRFGRSRARTRCGSRQGRLQIRRRAGSGGQAGAENGVLTVMCGGNEDAYAAAEPVITPPMRGCASCSALPAPGS